MNRNIALLSVTLTAVIVLALSGCASPASKDSVVVHSIPIAKQHQRTVSITTQGGSETSAMDSSNVSNSDFAKAIEESILENRLFTQVIHGPGADYLLNVTIVNMSKPVFGASFTVTMEAAWSLVEKSTNKVVMRDSIRSSHTATMGQAFVGVTRLRLALEGAVRENIRLGLMAISKLQLD
jgi:hypothetical protein